MRIVIDSNVLQEQALQDFLSKSRKNKALVTDYLLIEALKGDTLSKIFRLMKVLCEFPKQVVVLKSLRSISSLKGRRSGMTRRMIDERQTREYDRWCSGLAKAEAGDGGHRQELIQRGKEATAQVDALIAAQSGYAEIIADEATNYTQDELRILRIDDPYTPAMIDKMAERLVALTTKFIESHPDGIRPPTIWELPYTYLFRLAVCAYVHTLARIRDGGVQNVTAEKVTNDIIDATFVAQATYFQGLMSNDTKANALYRNVKHVLRSFPVSPAKLHKLA
jgi:hypothetical protein